MSLFAFLGFASCEEDKKETENNTPKEIKYTIVWDGVYPLTDIIINEYDKDKVFQKRVENYIPAPTGIAAEKRTFTTDLSVVRIEVFSKSNGKYFYDSREVKDYKCDILMGTKEITLEEYNNGIWRKK